MPSLIKFANLPYKLQQQILSSGMFPYWYQDSRFATKREWAESKAFYVTRDALIADRPGHCEPAFLAEKE